MVEGETSNRENGLETVKNVLRKFRGRARWVSSEVGSCGVRTAVAMSVVALTGVVGFMTLASLPLFESRPGPILATSASEKPRVVQIPAPTPTQELDYIRRGMLEPTPVAGRKPLVVEATLSRGKAVNGLVFGDWLQLAECPDGSYGWQVRYLNGVQSDGFFNSSGGFTKSKGPRSWGLIVYDRLYINPKKDLGTYEGSGVLECLAGHIGSSRVTESRSLQYRIELTP
ncbi:MAG: hypothetical protein Q7S44_00150 [bacterium]|nr:hypothetical protein [bacterium]